MYFLFLTFILSVNNAYGQNPIVETSVGTIEGLPGLDGDYIMFLGIPFARVNASNPFGEAIPNPVFEETFQAFDDSAICPQREEFNDTIVGIQECLHLHVYVPNSVQNSSNPLPVFVYIFGGRFEIGFAGSFLYGPKFIVRHDVILITFNYRLGPYGFMCLDIPEVPGNQGLKDQILALRWIRDNINAFGGDPEQITIFGQSAGSMSIDFHLYSSNTENLYQNVIMQSGHVLVDRIMPGDPSAPLVLADYLGFQVSDVYEAIAALSTVDPHFMIEVVENLNIQFGICLEQEFEGVDSFLTENPLNLEPKVQNKTILMGITAQERLGYVTYPLDDYEEPVHFETIVRRVFNLNDEEVNKLVGILKRFYIGDQNEAFYKMWGVIDFLGDITFNYRALQSMRKYLDNGAEKVYTYVFAHVGERNFLKDRVNITIGGASHADELGYLFDISYMGTPSERDQLTVDRMTKMWTNFAKYGDPTPEISDLLPLKWEPVVKGSQYHYMDIDSTLNMWKSPFHERFAFMDLLFAAYGQYEFGYEEKN